MNNATELREQMLAERRLKIFLDRQEKLKMHNMNLNKNHRYQMMKSLDNMAKIKSKDQFIESKLVNSSLRLQDVKIF